MITLALPKSDNNNNNNDINLSGTVSPDDEVGGSDERLILKTFHSLFIGGAVLEDLTNQEARPLEISPASDPLY